VINKKKILNKITGVFGYEIERRTESVHWMENYRRNVSWKISLPKIDLINKKKRFWDLLLYEEKSLPVKPVYLNIGAGSFFHPRWHNLDWVSEKYAYQQKSVNIEMDLKSKEPFPVKQNSVKIAYTSHLIEHLPQHCVEHIFKETYKVLKQGGIFRITCPDIDLEYNAYINGKSWLGRSVSSATSKEQIFLERFAYVLTEKANFNQTKKYTDEEIKSVFFSKSKEEALDYFINQIPDEANDAYPGAHMNWFNENKLFGMLKKVGFTNIKSSRFGQSAAIQLRNVDFFDNTHPYISLYVECYKT